MTTSLPALPYGRAGISNERRNYYMRIQSLTLYKTPLDSEYKNVYDDYESADDYKEFLDEAFQKIVISPETVKSRHDKNGHFSVIIAYYDSMELHDFNYICVDYGLKTPTFAFAFITSINSINDGGVSTQSCEIVCKLDAWANHYEEMKECSIVTNRCTYDENINRYFPNGNYKLKYETMKNNVKYLQSNNYGVILWERVGISDNNVKLHLPGQADTNIPTNFTFSGGTIFAYRPAALIADGSLSNLGIKTRAYKYGGSPLFIEDTPVIKSSGFLMEIDSHVTSSIISSHVLTYNVPFDYSISPNLSDPSYVLVTIDKNTSVWGELIYDSNSITVNSFIIPAYVNQSPSIKTITLQELFSLPLNPTSRRYIHYNNPIDFDELALQTYPFKYYGMRINSNIIPIIPKQGSNGNIYIDYDFINKVNPSFKIYSSLNENVTWNSISPKSQLDIAQIPIDEYLYRNQNKLDNARNVEYGKMITSFISGSLLAMSGTPPIKDMGNIVMSGFALEKLNAIKEDLENTPNAIPKQLEYSSDNIFELDNIEMWSCIANKTSTDIKHYIYRIHAYGEEISLTQKIGEKTRDVFDYQEGDIILNCSLNEEDRNEIISAFSRGVRRWHIGDAVDTQARMDCVKTMDTYIPNFPLSLLI